MKEYTFLGKTYYLKTDVDNRTIHLDGWKGKDKLQVTFSRENNKDVYIVIEHRKDKESGEVAQLKHIIPRKNVEFVYDLIKERTKNARSTKYREIAIDIITKKNLPISIDEFNGGHQRGRYHQIYYFPVKILESLGKIRYSGRGVIINLNKK